jgi:hypothetical protein
VWLIGVPLVQMRGAHWALLASSMQVRNPPFD